jgi:hypothetical protein
VWTFLKQVVFSAPAVFNASTEFVGTAVFQAKTIFQAPVEFISSIIFRDNTTFEKDVQVKGDTTITGTLTVNQNQAGGVTIPAGTKGVRVLFNQVFPSNPVVTVTPQVFFNGQYKVTAVQTDSFELQLSEVQAQDVVFNWQALVKSDVGANVRVEVIPEGQSDASNSIQQPSSTEPTEQEPASESNIEPSPSPAASPLPSPEPSPSPSAELTSSSVDASPPPTQQPVASPTPTP